MRGIAAVTVVVGHIRGLFFADWANLPNQSRTPVVALLYFLTGLGRQAVMVFFVLSGFFIGWSVIGSMRSGRWSWPGYLVRRLTRLGIVLLPALLLTAFWDLAGIALFGAHSAYLGGRPGDAVLTFRVIDYLSPQVFLGNLFFLQGIDHIPTFGSNAPLWSLSYEFWYYMLFPLMASVFVVHGPVRWAFAVVAGLILIFIGPSLAVYYLTWLLGVGIVLTALMLGTRRRILAAWAMAPASVIFGVGLVVGERRLIWGADGFLAVACAIFLTAIIFQRSFAPWSTRLGQLYSTAARRLAGCSYTLYLVHLPILIFLRAAFGRGGPWILNGGNLTLALIILLLVFGYALAVASVTESHTDQLRQWVLRRIPSLA